MANYLQLNKEIQGNETRVIMHTDKGDMTFKLFPEIASRAVENLVTYAKNGYYDGITLHRVTDSFMIQGGDPIATGTGGENIYGGSFGDEFSLEAFNLHGVLSMANIGPNTNSSRSPVVQMKEVPDTVLNQLVDGGWPEPIAKAHADKDGTSWLDQKHTVFGQLIDGETTLEDTANTEVGAQDKPVHDAVIESIDVGDQKA